MKLFELRVSGPESGDCTVPYDVIFDRECTVREFINEVLMQKEWGFISICNYYNGNCIHYDKDAIVSGKFDTDLLESKIKKATASGGWTRMDYWIDIFTGEHLLRKEYAQTLKEMARLESEYKKLTKKAYDIERQLTSLESLKSTETEKPQLDKDGCVYWDSVLK